MMSVPPDKAVGGELEAARRAVAATLLDANVNLIFGSPVDVTVLTDYLDIVETPKDLGTVLEDIDRSLQGSGPYKTAADVLNDISLVWSNCLKYNDRPEDKAIIDICRRSAKLLDKEWIKAGLQGSKAGGLHLPKHSQPGDEPSSSKAQYERDLEPLPLRLLTNFEVATATDSTALRGLDALPQQRAAGHPLVISGELIPPGADPSERGQPLPPEQLVDWCAEYSGPDVEIWAITDTAWYRLVLPTERYKSLYITSIKGVALAREVLEELAAGEEASDIPALVERIANNLAPPTDSSEPLSKEVKDLAVAHVEIKIGRRKFKAKPGRKRRGSGLPGSSNVKRPRGGGLGKSMSRSRLGPGTDGGEDGGGYFIGDEMDNVSDDDMPDDFQISDDEAVQGQIDPYEGPGKARRRAWRRIKYWRRRAEEEERQRAAEAALVEQERQANAARGPPPDPEVSSRLPLECLPDLLMVWEFAQSFGDVLQLPPFFLTALEAALDPGPRIRKEETWNTSHSKESKKEIPNGVEAAAVGDKEEEEEGKPSNFDKEVTKMEGTEALESGEKAAAAVVANGGDAVLKGAGKEEKEESDGHGDIEMKEADTTTTATAIPSGGAPDGAPSSKSVERKGPKIAPQNVILDPTIKTRLQRGVEPTPSEKALALAEGFEPAGTSGALGPTPSPPLDTKPPSKIKLKVPLSGSTAGAPVSERPSTPTVAALSPDNPVAAALSMAQARQDAYIAQLQKYGLSPETLAAMLPLDRDSAAAGLLLRDLVSSLASAAAGLLPGTVVPGQPAPRAAKLSNPDAEHPSWPERLANTVWGAIGSPPAAREAALKLAYGDYLDLTPEERLRLLVALTHAALSSEAMIAEISLRVDQFGSATVRRDGAAGDELDDEGGRLAAAAVAAVIVPRAPPPPPPPPPGVEAPPTPPTPPPPTPLELWRRWSAAQNLGIRRPLGIDFLGRRYWALGHQAGAFRVYCEEPEGQRWGWYEGDSIQSLITWLSAASIRCETSLVTALGAAPLPFSNPTPSAPARRLAGSELVNLRLDGYRGLTLPLLRGEWNSRKEGAGGQPPPPMEQRIPLAIDVLLGSVPSWFKGEVVQRHMMAVSDVIAGAHYGRDAARALLETESLLNGEGRLSEEWRDVWQAPWRRCVAGLMDVRDVPLCTAALQTHVKTAPDIIPRPAFMKIATETNFVLTIPSLGDTVIVLRAGLLQHIDRYMQLVGAAAPSEVIGDAATIGASGGGGEVGVKQETGPAGGAGAGAGASGAPSHGIKDEGLISAGVSVLSAGTNRDLDEDHLEIGSDRDLYDKDVESSRRGTTTAGTDTASASAVPHVTVSRASRGGVHLLAAPRVKESAIPRIKRDWETLRSRAAALRPAERYIVRTIVYRRHLADADDLETDEASEMAPRAPVAWVFLRPARYGPRHQLPHSDIVLPVAIVPGLPDYLLKVEAYVNGSRVSWQAGDRFRMFFGGKISEKTLKKVKAGGTWHKGEVVAVDPVAPLRSANVEEKEKYDPWESVVVRWDHLAEDYVDKVNPWELEVDPEEETRRWDEARRQQQAAARAQRARASARRAADDPEAAAQAAEWAEEDAKLAGLAAQAERANLLLTIHKSKPEPEVTVFNDVAYGPMAMQTQQILLATLGAPALMAHAAAAAAVAAAAAQRMGLQQAQQAGMLGTAPGALPGGAAIVPGGGPGSAAIAGPSGSTAAAKSGGGGGGGQGASGTRSSGAPTGAAAPASNIPTGPLKPGQEVPAKVLEALKMLNSEQFITLLTNFYRGLKGKFKVPTFAHRELDLHAVWWSVMDRGGYEVVTNGKQWRDICRCLPQLDLSGQTSASYNMRLNYERCLLDFENYLASGQYEADLAAGKAPTHTHLTDPALTRFTIPGAYPAVPAVPLVAAAVATGAPTVSTGAPLPQPETATTLPVPAAPLPTTIPLRLTISAAPTPPIPTAQPPAPPETTTAAAAAPVQPPQATTPLGAQLTVLGQAAVGRIVQRYWPDEGGWWDAQITGYNPDSKEHQLTYNVGKADESFEWTDLRELSNAEFRDKVRAAGKTPNGNLTGSGGGAMATSSGVVAGEGPAPMEGVEMTKNT